MESEPPPPDNLDTKSDTIPSSSTDADLSSVSSQVLDDPISSTSVKDESIVEKTASVDTDDELLEINMSRQPAEKITENVDDLVNDLETLLGESSDNISIVSKQDSSCSSNEESNANAIIPEMKRIDEVNEQLPESTVSLNVPIDNFELRQSEIDESVPDTDISCGQEEKEVQAVVREVDNIANDMPQLGETELVENTSEITDCVEEAKPEDVIEDETTYAVNIIAESVVQSSEQYTQEVNQSTETEEINAALLGIISTSNEDIVSNVNLPESQTTEDIVTTADETQTLIKHSEVETAVQGITEDIVGSVSVEDEIQTPASSLVECSKAVAPPFQYSEVETALQGITEDVIKLVSTEEEIESPVLGPVSSLDEHSEVQTPAIQHSEVESAVQGITEDIVGSVSAEDEIQTPASSLVERSNAEAPPFQHSEVETALQGITEHVIKSVSIEEEFETPVSSLVEHSEEQTPTIQHSEVEGAVQRITPENVEMESNEDEIQTPVSSLVEHTPSIQLIEVETAVRGIIQEEITSVSTEDEIQTPMSSSVEHMEVEALIDSSVQHSEVEMAVQGIIEENDEFVSSESEFQTVISSSIEHSEVESAVQGIINSNVEHDTELQIRDDDSMNKDGRIEEYIYDQVSEISKEYTTEEEAVASDTIEEVIAEPSLLEADSEKHTEEVDGAKPELNVGNEPAEEANQEIIGKFNADQDKTEAISDGTESDIPKSPKNDDLDDLSCKIQLTSGDTAVQETVDAEEQPESHQEIEISQNTDNVLPSESGVLNSSSKPEEKIEPIKFEEESHKQPLTITVEDDEKVEEPVKVTHRAQITEQETSKGHLKMTITKHSDKMHSILKVYDPEEKQELAVEEDPREEPIPKLIIKNKQQQSSPKTSSKKSFSPPGVSASSDLTIGSLSPLKITLKTVGKSEEPLRRNSPKSSVRDDSEAPKHQSPRITIKPIIKPEAESEESPPHLISTPKVTIKPVKRPLDVESEPDEGAPSPKVTIRPVLKQTELEEDMPSSHSPKITIKPIRKSESEESQSSPRSKCEDHEEVKERIVLKINKGSVSSKESKKRESQPEEEKLAKIKLKFSKEGGHPHIVSQAEDKRRHTRSEDVQTTKEDIEYSSASETTEMHRLSQSEGSGSSKKVEECTIEIPSPIEAMQIPMPTPKRRGRPRKNPLIPREEARESPTYTSSPRLDETMSPAPSPGLSPATSREVTPSRSVESTPPTPNLSEGRPKRSCRGQNVIATLGIKPRKPRGRGRGRGSNLNMGDRVFTPLVPESPTGKDTSPSKMDQSQAFEVESRKTPEIEPPKKPGRRRRKTSDQHKDTASDTSSVISLDDDEHLEPKSKVAKSAEPKETIEEKTENNAPTVIDPKTMARRQKLIDQLAKARQKRSKAKESSKSKRHERVSSESEKLDNDGQFAQQTSVDSDSLTSENKRESFVVVSQDRAITTATVTNTNFQPPSPEKPNAANSGMEEPGNSSGLAESLVDEETRMSADQGFREAVPVKQALSTEVAPEDSQSSLQSTGTTESGKTGNSGKNSRTRLEVNQELDSNVVTVDQLAEYFWDSGGPFMLQEQVSLYLGVTSFKRKYPNIVRRAVDMQERDYLRENGFASEAMCNLGLTAVSSHDIIDIMFKDFQDKYEEYCRHTQEKQAKELLSKQKALSQQSSQQQKFFDKTELMEQAIQSTLQWNKEFNKERMEHRQASMDLQTFTVHYPKEKMRRLIKPNVGSYPVALVPGQFTDYYKDLTAMEINNLPLNSLGTGYLESSDIDSDSSDGDSDSSSSTSSSDYSSDEDCKLCAKHTQTPVKTNIA